ncbi:MAG: hypothetical protein IPK33_11445 [Gemmatimonadetes bacterium]|nr:hypothetical protein [Gemmatimonadota bacterium]
MTAVAPDASPTTASLDDVLRKWILTVLFVGVFMAAPSMPPSSPGRSLRAALASTIARIGLVTIVFSLGFRTRRRR